MAVTERFSLVGKHALLNSPELSYGPEIACGLVEAGAALWLCGTAAKIEQTARRLEAQGVRVAGLFAYEQGTEAAAEALAREVRRTCAHLDIFVNNGPQTRLERWDCSFEEIDAALRFSQLGLILTVKHLGLLMREREGGSVIFVSDYAALVACDPQNYAADPQLFERDFALDHGFVSGSYVNYARQAAGFLGEKGIRCNTLAFSPPEYAVSPSFMQAYCRHSHIKRPIRAEDIKGAVVFLASDASAYVTGVTLPVDGGYTAK